MRSFEDQQKQDVFDARAMAYANSEYLHNSTNTAHCGNNVMNCLLCLNAARLSVKWLRPRIEKRIVSQIMDMYNVRCDLSHPGGD